MAQVYTFIATKTTYATTIPLYVESLADLTRRVRNALSATDYPTRIGELRDYPLPVAIENFLLCDGSEIPRLSFPELADYLENTQGTPVDPLKFKLPNYLAAKVQAPTAPAQVITATSSSIGTPPPAETTPAAGEAGGTPVSNPPSGGRFMRSDDFGQQNTQFSTP